MAPNNDSLTAPLFKAVKFNTHTLKKVRAAMDAIQKLTWSQNGIPVDYSVRLQTMRESSQTRPSKLG
ncbi:hypothetical protein DPV78_008001 [Talaromyces pinophilus]|nr:hypothetical protein DPV78_008001 [Talaromyces pinophilus]